MCKLYQTKDASGSTVFLSRHSTWQVGQLRVQAETQPDLHPHQISRVRLSKSQALFLLFYRCRFPVVFFFYEALSYWFLCNYFRLSSSSASCLLNYLLLHFHHEEFIPLDNCPFSLIPGYFGKNWIGSRAHRQHTSSSYCRRLFSIHVVLFVDVPLTGSLAIGVVCHRWRRISRRSLLHCDAD